MLKLKERIKKEKMTSDFKKKEAIYEIDLFNATNERLMEISDEMGLALNIQEMIRIRNYFKEKGRRPTDVELQALGQAWSEHCCYKSSLSAIKKHIYSIEKKKIVAREDAGVAEFDENHHYVVAFESHNHPSAIEPYGGAATGIGGIVRDVVCMGAQPIALIDPLFFASLDYPFDELPKGVKHPRYLFKKVTEGIRDYGNRIGIPTVAGQVYFHDGYVGNCLVNVGCVGIVRKDEMIHSSAGSVGNIFIYAGGKTGRDGIHGVTFASAELTKESEEESRSAVQLGDPITKEPLIHACLECAKLGLLEGMKDFGGGGLSCVCGELAHESRLGAEISLDKIPLKEEGMAPWEIWVSESQERMMLMVDPKNLDEVLQIFKEWDILAIPIGRTIEEQVMRVFYKEKMVAKLDLDFQTSGVVYDRPYKIREIKMKEREFEMPNLDEILEKILSSPNVASKEWVIRQYDHEVRGNTVIKVLQGKILNQTHGDAVVVKPLENSYRGIAIATDVNPFFTSINPYTGARSAVDEVCRNLVSVGAYPNSLADCLNFGNPEKMERMGELWETCRGLGEMASSLKLPFISGNVSLYNETIHGAVPPTPTIVGIGIVEDIRKCVTAEFKENGNPVYLIGETRKEMGASEYYKAMGSEEGIIPSTNAEILRKSMDALIVSMKKGIIKACHDASNGGIGICLAEMAIGGLGAEIRLHGMGKLRMDFKLFSESNTRWIVEVKRGREKEFEELFKEIKLVKIGQVGGTRLVIYDKNDKKEMEKIIDMPIDHLRKIWNKGLWKLMGD